MNKEQFTMTNIFKGMDKEIPLWDKEILIDEIYASLLLELEINFDIGNEILLLC